MALYTQSTSLPTVLWLEPLETVWQVLTSGPGVPGSKIPHLSLADELFVAAVANIRRPGRGAPSRGWRMYFRFRGPRSMRWAAGLGGVWCVGSVAGQPRCRRPACRHAELAVTIRSPSRPTGWSARR